MPIASSTANHVHARVLPGAPLDDAGLPIPSVAVATAGGASVIHPNGQVYNLTDAAGIARSIFLDDGRIMLTPVSGGALVSVGPIPYATAAVTSWRQFFYSATASVTAGALRFSGAAVANNLARNAIGSGTGGLTFLAEDPANPAAGMVAYAATNYATGWQPGDCRLASLCDIATGNITGTANLIANGSFDTDLTGWTVINNGGSTTTWSSGAAALLGDGTNLTALDQSFTTVVGQTYVMSFDVGSNALSVMVGTSQGGTQLLAIVAYPVGRNIVQFTATTTTTWLRALRSTATTATLDNVSIQLAIPDRSYRGRGLRVNGTITRTAVGAGSDVVAHSGWSAANYYDQPYNPDFDYGTGDFSIAVWMRTTNSSGTALHRFGTGTRAIRLYLSSGNITALVNDGTASSFVTTTTPVNTDTWRQVVFCRRAGAFQIWVDGVLAGSTTASRDLSDTAGTVRLGLLDNGTDIFVGSLAMLRATSAYAPTPAQIRRMFAAERPLFDAGVRCTLGGASNAVQKLAFDESQNTLIVGTGDGVSEFNGLIRTEYFDTSNIGPLTNDNIQGVGGAAGFRVIAGTGQAVARSDAVNGLDMINRHPPRAPYRDGIIQASGRTTDATPSNLAPRIFVGERELVRGQLLVTGRQVGAAGAQMFSTLLEFVISRAAGGNITLNLAAANQKDTLWNGTAAIDGTVETSSTLDAAIVVDTASQTFTPQVTGLAATVMAWEAVGTFDRISEENRYAA